MDEYFRSVSLKLWNEHALNDKLSKGIYIKAHRVEVDVWNNVNSLNSTGNTRIEVSTIFIVINPNKT